MKCKTAISMGILLTLVFASASMPKMRCAYYEDSTGFEKHQSMCEHGNHSIFWDALNPNILWDVETNLSSCLVNVTEYVLGCAKKCKYELAFFAPNSTDYQASLSINLPLEEMEIEEGKIKMKYKHAEMEFEFEYNWEDLINQTEFDLAFSHALNQSGFFFYATGFFEGNSDVILDPYLEDYTTYNETDPLSHISVSENRINFTGLRRSESSYVYKDRGAGFFSGDFDHFLDVNITDWDGAYSQRWRVSLWSLTNKVSDYYQTSDYAPPSIEDGIFALVSIENLLDQNYTIHLRELYNDVWQSTIWSGDYPLVQNNTYYFRIKRISQNLNCSVYLTSQNRTDELNAILSIQGALQSIEEYSHIYALQSLTMSSGGLADIDGYVENLCLNLNFTLTFYYNTGGIFRVDNATITNASSIEYEDHEVIELGSLPQNATYVFLNFSWTYGNSTVNPYNMTVLDNSTVWLYFSEVDETTPLVEGLFLGGVLSFVIALCIGVGLYAKRPR